MTREIVQHKNEITNNDTLKIYKIFLALKHYVYTRRTEEKRVRKSPRMLDLREGAINCGG